jgi:thioredoxin 1
MDSQYLSLGPDRDEIDASLGPLVLEFGADWCGYCQAAEPAISEALAKFPDDEDGPGRRLGRSFRVKIWPTVIFLKDGTVVTRAVRPESAQEVELCLQQIT